MTNLKIDKSKCAGCGACVNICPYGAIKIGKDGKAIIDEEKCQMCGKCEEICPFDAIQKIEDEKVIMKKFDMKRKMKFTIIKNSIH